MGSGAVYGGSLGTALLAVAALLGGCMPEAPADFNSPEPASRNAAIVKAARERDQSAIPDLVRMLDSDDPAARVLAIRTLERLSGQTLGYDPQADERQRQAAVVKWKEWCEARVASP